MEVALTHCITYQLKRDVPVSIVARTLLANERLIQESARLVSDLFPLLEVQKVSVKVSHLSNESPLREVFALGVFLAFQKDLETEVPAFIEAITGQQIPDSANTFVTVLVILICIYVIDAAVERMMPGKSTARLKEEYERRLDELSEMINIPKDQIESAIQARMSEGKIKSLFRKAQDFFLPAKLERGAWISLARGTPIESGIIDEVPSDVELEQRDQRNTYELHGVAVEIHRADVDYPDQGWISVIEDVSEKRVKTILSPDIDPASLYGQKRVIGDVTVVEERQLDGDFVVKEFHLAKVQHERA